MTDPSQLDHLLHLYRQMQLIRRVEEEAAAAYARGKIGGFLHLYIGQEAVAVGCSAAMRPGDTMIGTYRDHGMALVRGMSARALMAELYGKDTGCSRGLGGSMHLFDAKNRMLGGYGIVGGHIPIAAGVAFASKYRDEKAVTLCFFGEGAVPIGDFHEGLSLAALWKLPVVFVCENNEFAMGTPLSRTLSVEDVTLKAPGYGMKSDRLVVEDVLEVEAHMRKAIDRAREENEPALIELRTYRFRGHSMSDPGKYRSREEVEAHKARDPLLRARNQLIEAGRGADAQRVDDEVEAEVQDAVQFAETSPEPSADLLEATTYIGPFAR
jgi:pyruvate dehydrogenase E1 component alpha subunit